MNQKHYRQRLTAGAGEEVKHMDYVHAFEQKKRHRRNAIIAGLLLEFVGASAVGQILGDTAGLVFFLLVIIGFLAYMWWDWRCPACRKRLAPEFAHGACPHCGTRLTP